MTWNTQPAGADIWGPSRCPECCGGGEKTRGVLGRNNGNYHWNGQSENHWKSAVCFFPTCQVRVVRFYHSCSPPPPPPRLAILLLLLLLLRQHLLHHLCLHFHVHCCLANSSPSSSPTSELSVHRWTSTWDLPSSVGTAGPQLGTFPAQCALLDLNLGPSQLSVHRWTSTAR